MKVVAMLTQMGSSTSQIPTIRLNFNLRKCIVSHCCLRSVNDDDDVEINTSIKDEFINQKCLRSNSIP